MFRHTRFWFVFFLVAFGLHVRAEEMKPDFDKLKPVELFPSLVASATSNRVPITGFDAANTPNGPDLNPGDTSTALITLFEKGGRKTQFLLYVEADERNAEEKARPAQKPAVLYIGAGDQEEFVKSNVPVKLRLLGPFTETTGKGKQPKVNDVSARIELNEGFLGLGLDQAAAAFYRMAKNNLKGSFPVRDRPFTEDEITKARAITNALQLSRQEERAIAGSGLALMSYLKLVQETPGLDDLFEKVVTLPSVWSMIRRMGVSPNLELEKQYVGPMDGSGWNVAPGAGCYTFPLALRLNDEPSVTATFVVAPPRPQLLGCAGIVSLLAEKAGDKDTYLVLRIVSAHQKADSPGSDLKK